MIDELLIQKSFCLVGKSLPSCLGCKYCRLLDGSASNVRYSTLPSKINSLFKNLPVAVNLFYGDPMLQIGSTVNFLQSLEKDKHQGPVVIITKGDFTKFPSQKFNLNLHFAFSTFGVDNNIDGGSRLQFVKNLEKAKSDNRLFSIEFRPIVCGVNDDFKTLEWVLKQASNYSIPVGYSGLQGKPQIAASWRDQKLSLNPYPGFKFGHKKIVASSVEQTLQELASKHSVKIFRKTSCLMSYVHKLNRDYNAHYYRPSEVGCDHCVMKSKCSQFKNNLKPSNAVKLPFKHEIILKEKHECVLKKKNICEFPTNDCSNISGQIVKTDVKLTTADVRVTKWLTGMTVDADFVESPLLSDFWRCFIVE